MTAPYADENEALRLELVDPLDEDTQPALRAFFRRLGIAHVFSEYLVPSARTGHSLSLAAISDRPWPPWGIGAARVHGLVHLYPVSEGFAGFGGMWTSHGDLGNLGMVAALLKETIEELQRGGQDQMTLVAREDAPLIGAALTMTGFERGNDVLLTDEARYFVHSAGVKSMLDGLAIGDTYTPDLLAGHVPDQVAAFHAILQVGTWGYWHGWRRPDVLPEGGSVVASGPPPPGGVPGGVPTPPGGVPKLT